MNMPMCSSRPEGRSTSARIAMPSSRPSLSTLTSTKWWPGGMAKTATHAVVMARLVVGGRDHGPHAFIVQLRGLADHLPPP